MFELFTSNQLMCAFVDFDAYRVSRLYKLKIVMQRILLSSSILLNISNIFINCNETKYTKISLLKCSLYLVSFYYTGKDFLKKSTVIFALQQT